MGTNEHISFLGDFDPVTFEAWLAVVERDLKGASFDKRLVSQTDDGIRVQPLYSAKDAVDPAAIGYPGAPPFVRGSRSLGTRWAVCEPIDQRDPAGAAIQIQRAIERGADELWIQLDDKARAGRDWDRVDDLPAGAPGGVMLSRLAQLSQLLERVDLAQLPIGIDAGAQAIPAAALLLAHCRARDIALDRISGSLNADPLGALAADGRLSIDLQQALSLAADLASYLVSNAPAVRGLTVSTLPYHDAGATPAQELAVALATGLTYLRRLTEAGLTVDQACSQLLFRLTVGRDVFGETAKLRAFRLCWSRLTEACGASVEARPATLHACTARRTKTKYDPWVNMLRVTAEVFAAAVGGAESITSSAFDEVLGCSDAFARRIARNTQIVLQEEAYVARVADPAGGSWYVEALTRQLAEAAWEQFQQIEREGGMVPALLEGKLQKRIEEAAATRGKAVAKRKLPITGVSEFPNVHEELPQRRAPDVTEAVERAQQQLQAHLEAHDQAALTSELTTLVEGGLPAAGSLTATAVDAAAGGATLGRIAAALVGDTSPTELSVALPRRRDAEPFERLRSACDAYADLRGSRPKAFLANLGPIPQHRARAEFSGNLLQAGGFEALTNDGFETLDDAARAFAESKAPLAVICSTDDDYRERAAELAGALKQQGARLVVLAGRPGDQEQVYRQAGIDHFIFLGCDVHKTLETLLETLEVIR
jgi:methylmalonyl-CoA mutase